MKRKVIQIGKFTQVISLPREWTQKYGIKKGDELNLRQEGNKVTINLNDGFWVEKTELDLRKGYEYNIRDIKALYRCGYDEVKVLFDDIKIINQLQHTLSEQLLGFEIVDQGENKCLIKDVVKESDADIDMLLRRLFRLTLSMAEESYDAISKKNIERLDEIQAMERMNNKLCNLCERILSKKGYTDHMKTLFIFTLVRELDQIADNFRDLCRFLLKEGKINISPDILKIYENVNALFNEVYELYYQFDIVRMAKHAKKREAIKNKAYELFAKNGIQNQTALHYLTAIISKVNHLAESFI